MNHDIQNLELAIEDAREMVAKRDALNRLTENRDFKTIVRKGYLEEEAQRLVHCSADINLTQQSEAIIEAIKGISHFKQFLNAIIVMGNNAEQAIVDSEEVLDELRAEEAEGQ